MSKFDDIVPSENYDKETVKNILDTLQDSFENLPARVFFDPDQEKEQVDPKKVLEQVENFTISDSIYFFRDKQRSLNLIK